MNNMERLVNKCGKCGSDEITLETKITYEPSLLEVLTNCSTCGSLSFLKYTSVRAYDLELQIDTAMRNIDLAGRSIEQESLIMLIQELEEELRELTGYYVN